MRPTKTQSYRIYFILISSFLFAVLIRSIFFGIYKVSSVQMMPSLIPGDVVLGLKLPHNFAGSLMKEYVPGFVNSLKRGEVIVYTDEDKYFVKRVVALPGDDVLLKEGRLKINGVELNYEVLNWDLKDFSKESIKVYKEQNNGSSYPILLEDGVEHQEFEYVIPPGKVLVLADGERNIVQYKDVVEADQIQARLFWVITSFDWGERVIKGSYTWRTERVLKDIKPNL